MKVYCLPEPTPAERDLINQLGGDSSEAGAHWRVFPNGELFVRVDKPEISTLVIGRTRPPSDDLLRTLLLVDTLQREGARDITVVIPYFGYSRQDRQVAPGDSVASELVLKALAAAGATRVVTVDMHSDRVTSISPIPVTNVPAVEKLAARIRQENLPPGTTILSPDKGGVSRAERFSALLGTNVQVAWMEKKRLESGAVAITQVHGELNGHTAVIVDDIVDTGSTIAQATNLLRDRGYTDIYLAVTHGCFSGVADVVIGDLGFKKIFVTDTVELPAKAQELPGLQMVRLQAEIAVATAAAIKAKKP